ncbi:MAG: hypothetical protein ACRDCW_15325 [Sarcina sp.]
MKKIILCIGIASIMVGTAVPAFADSIKKSANSFTSPWEKVTSNSEGTATMKYGYNEFLIDEDYTHTYHTKASHKALVANNGGSHYKERGARTWAKIEVTHKVGLVRYEMSW